jgi:alanyl-tRNA synthetase
MGLERIACIVQDADSLFDVDTIMNITRRVSRITGAEYGQNINTDISLRVITDHIRSTTMMISDGVLPSNEGRGYVLRRLLRRAARHGKLLGTNKPFLYELCETVISESKAAYPELAEKHAHIVRVIKAEEERFAITIDAGMKILQDLITEHKASGILPGAECFKLYDTFGFPIDLTIEILAENAMTADMDGFNAYMKEQRERARAATAALGNHGWEALDLGLPKEEQTVFTGYGSFIENDAVVRAVGDGWIVLDKTPFYAEMGGQIADTGTIGGYAVTDVKKTKDNKYLHLGEFEISSLTPGDKVVAAIDAERRKAIMRAHSSAHLLQAALRKILGNHIEQAGSWVGADALRFDFTHFQAVTPMESEQIDAFVNSCVLDDLCVDVKEMPLDEAKKLGAIALFGEKYGDVVRIVKMGDASIEFCGGTHLSNTAKVGSFRTLKEASIAAGVRRIEAVTGFEALHSYRSDAAKAAEDVASFQEQVKAVRKSLEQQVRKMMNAESDKLYFESAEVNGIRVIAASLPEADAERLKLAAERLRDRSENVAAVLAAVNRNKISFVAICGKAAIDKGVKAGELIKLVTAATGGRGGGKPDMAMGGGSDIDKLNSAIDSVNDYVKGITQ